MVLARRSVFVSDRPADYLAFLFDQLGMKWTPPGAPTGAP